ncbi:hypothetical protein EDB89DRAFT_2075584 [Lactarius sanguifluus]|nr:hypothetical protein EDB89DRAFT_2075584 [Lactarius sanguifluus]
MSSDETDNDSDISEGSSVASSRVNDAPPISTTQLTPDELREVLKDTQLKYQKLEKKFKSLRTKYNSLKSTKSGDVKKVRTLLVGDEKDIALAGGRFSFAYEPWVHDSIFEIDRPEGVDPLNVEHYNTALTRKVAIAAELYESLSPHLQEELADPRRRKSFIKIFQKQAKRERANTIYTARRVVGEILSIDTAYFRSKSKIKRDQVKELQDLLKDTGDPNSEDKYPVLAAVLFPSRDSSSTSPFAVEELPLFLKTILLGVSSLDGDPTGKRAPRATLWGITHTTPGMIALAATVITFVCGPDQTFSEMTTGPTGIEWGERFLLYKKMVLKLPPDYYTALLSWYDEQIFSKPTKTSTSAKLPSKPKRGHDTIDDLIGRMSRSNVTPAWSLPTSATPHYEDEEFISPSPSFSSAPGSPGLMSAPAITVEHVTVERDLTDQIRATPVPEQEDVAPRPPKNRKGRGAQASAPAQTGTRKTTRSCSAAKAARG